MTGWRPTIGLEVHVQLATRTKLFCGCPAGFGAPPNTQVCAVCAGLPGALPSPNREAVALALRAGLALGCAIAPRTRFDRKHYAYPDLPKGYQISQLDAPLCGPGALAVDGPDGRLHTVRIRRAHLEEDAGKLLHDRHAHATAVDLNRCGVPLVEIVTEPDLDDPALAEAWLRELRRTLVAARVSECDMEKGSLRCDANVSVRRADAPAPGERVEIKNLNSFRHVRRALAHEIERQTAVLAAGGAVERETRGYDPARDVTRPQRGKEEARDYRDLPDPDLRPPPVDAAWVEALRAALPELPRARRERFAAEFGLAPADAAVLTEEPAVADLFEATAAALGDARTAATWVQGEVLALAKGRPGGVADLRLTAEALAELLRALRRGALAAAQAKAVLAEMAETGAAPDAIIAARGLRQESDAGTVEAVVRAVLAAHPGAVADHRAGRQAKAIGFLMGQVMRASGGAANPRVARAALERLLGAEAGA